MIEQIPSSSIPTSIIHRNISFPLDDVHDQSNETITITTTPSPLPIKKCRGIYPSLIVGLSMVSRGEIGFLIANISLSTNILSTKAFIVTIWAILLNTILGPIAVGLMIKLFGSKLNDGLWID